MGTDLVKSYTRYDFGLSDLSISAIDDQNRDIMYQIKDNLVTNCGGVVVSSSDSSTADATDNWSTSTDLVWNTGAHSWIVIQFDSITTGVQLCIDLSRAYSSSETGTILISADGFTGGTTTNRPTASDEAAVVTDSNWGGSNFASLTKQYSIIKTTDNTIIYIIGFVNGGPTCFWLLGKAVNGPTLHDTPMFAYVTNIAPLSSSISSGAYFRTIIDSEPASCYVLRPYSGIDPIASGGYYTSGFDIEGNIMMWSHSFISSSPSRPGSYGYFPDLYWVNTTHSDLQYIYQSDGSTLGWIVYGDFALPCGSTIIPR